MSPIDKKLKRNNTVYIRKHLSKDKNLKNKKDDRNNHNISQFNLNRYENIDKEDEDSESFYKSNLKRINKYNSSKKIIRINNYKNEDLQDTNKNINSNVNIFNFDMKYNNSPNYFIKNSKIYSPYFNNYLPNTLNNERELGTCNNLLSFKNKTIQKSFNDSNTIIKLDNTEEGENEMQLYEQSATIIQSFYRGYMIRFQINNLLKAYKGIEYLDYFFKNKFWKYFRNILIYMKSNIITNDIDSKMSISSISCISALFNSNKNFAFKTFNSKILHKEVKESFTILNSINNNLEKFQNNNNNESKIDKTLIWNKKKIYKNNIINQKISLKNINNIDKNNLCIKNEKENILKILVLKRINHSRIYLLKYFMKFYYNGILFNIKIVSKNENKLNEIDIKKLKKEKLKIIIEKKEQKALQILYKFFYKFNIKGLIQYMENNRYHIFNGGRLQDISQNSFFIYESKKLLQSNINKENNQFRNMKITLEKINVIRKIISRERKIKKEIIKNYFIKFHLRGIIYYMNIELKKRIILKKLYLDNNKNENILKKEINDDDNEKKNNKIRILRKLIYKNNKIYLNISKNIFDKWNLRTKIFSMIAIDKEKKKKRRIKKRNNKKLGSNKILNNPNNNINNNSNNNTNNSNVNKIILNNSPNSNIEIKSNNKNTKLIQSNYIVNHLESLIYSNNIKTNTNDNIKINTFFQKINGILTKKFYFFSLILNNYKIYKNNKDEENKKTDDIDFFMEDSSDESED